VNQANFEQSFKDLTGNLPFPWQWELYKRLAEKNVPASKNIPGACVIPTGLGKTSVIAIWLLARDENPSLPRRLVYVVNRRTVVDQTTDEVVAYQKKRENLYISTLRGQLADNRDWSADPSRLAVICGTVDMIGSRLLFSGYGIGFRQRPLHAAFLAQDTLLVHDEAHLEEPFQQLVMWIEQEQAKFTGTSVAPALRVMALTATPRGAKDVLYILDADRSNKEVKKRLDAAKQLTLIPITKELDVAAKIVDLAYEFQNANRAVLVFIRTLDQVKKAVDGLLKKKIAADHIAQLTGTLRGYERDQLVENAVFKRFLPKPPADAMKGTVYLICTSAGEVGVNISGDDLVCDLSTFESMAQRFGRINRFGKCSDSTVTVIHTTNFDDQKEIEVRRKKTLELLQRLTSVNPNALNTLYPNDAASDPREAAFSPTPKILELNDILLDGWSMTSIRTRMPGRPDVEPYLHGIPESEEPETHVAWREEIGKISHDMFEDYPPRDLLELYPLKPHELLSDRSKRVFEELKTLAKHFGDRRVWLVDDYGEVDAGHTLAWLTSRDESPIKGKTVLLPHDVGGLNKHGMLDGAVLLPKQELSVRQKLNDVADVLLDKENNLIRVRVDDKAAGPTGMRLICTIKWPQIEDDEADQRPPWFWFEKPAPTENSRNSIEPVLLDIHVRDVEDGIKAILDGLSLEPWIANALRLAAKWHDLGKRRERWQNSIGRPEKHKDKWFAKSGRKWVARREGAYRHEFGSLLDITQLDEFKQLDERTKDLVLHLIATHHGMARPHFEEIQTIDSNHPADASSAMSIESAQRFARLQRKFGHWGLAYLESILRAADWRASAEPSAFCSEEVK
jgi:CRISPR-associated endonuclease/helicase Cas3